MNAPAPALVPIAPSPTKAEILAAFERLEESFARLCAAHVGEIERSAADA